MVSNTSSNILEINSSIPVSVSEIIYQQKNRDTARIGKVKYVTNNQVKNIILEIFNHYKSFVSINKNTTIKLLFYSSMYTLAIWFTYFYFTKNSIPFSSFKLPSIYSPNAIPSQTFNLIPLVTTFLGVFAYKYTLFNNQWKYTADLYNKIYIDQSYTKDEVGLLRKRCLMAHDIYIQDLANHRSFSFEYNQTIILAAIVCKEMKLIENPMNDVWSKSEDGKFVKIFINPLIILHECIKACEDEEFYNYKQYIQITSSKH